MRWLLISLPLIFLLGCDPELSEDGLAPRVTELRPQAVTPDAPLTILGFNFGIQGPQDGAFLGGQGLVVESWSNETLLVRLPAEHPLGTFLLVIRSGARTSEPVPLEVRRSSRDQMGDAGADAAAETDSGNDAAP